MAGASEKLYPPTISGSLPAFYEENGTAFIAVPFSMNRAANQSEIGGFKLKIKTVQSNTEITTLSNNSPSIAIAEGKVTFEWTGFDPETHKNTIESKTITLGQYLKVQLAYVHTSGIVGYFSTVGIIKYTSKPNVYIAGLNPERGSINRFNYVGVFEPGEDKSERPYYYNFSLFNNIGELVEATGWLLHNTSIDTVASESLSLDKTTDSYSFNTALKTNADYWVEYSVRTINDLEVTSRLYKVSDVDTGLPLLNTELSAENCFEDGFIMLRFVGDNNNVLSEPVSLEILRAERTDNYTSWRLITQVYISSYQYAISDWNFKDFTVEQGMTYKYCFREYNAFGVQSNRIVSNEVFCDFEDMFLFDGEKQLKIRFNPKMSSFKVARLETKSDTIGSRYPFIFRNGVVGYKEFPIAGLISYKMDSDNELFVNHREDLNILLGSEAERNENPVNQENDDTDLGKSWEISETLDSIGYNVRAERRFKLKVMEWLGDGKIKLFRSPTEGNYLVRLMNISFSPEDKLNRMLHSFSANAYEVEECNYNNLYRLGFFNAPSTVKTNYAEKTVRIADKIPEQGGSFKINDEPIIGYVRLELSPGGSEGTPFHVRVGDDDILVVAPGYFLGVKGNHTVSYPDFYYDANFNKNGNNEPITNRANILTLVGDAQLTYMYENKQIAIGAFHNIIDAYLETEVVTFSGNNNWIDFNLTNTNQREETIVKFYSLKFRQKNNNNNETGTDIKLKLLSNNEYVVWTMDQETILDLTAEINSGNYILTSIYLGENVEAECAYQVKVIEKEG